MVLVFFIFTSTSLYTQESVDIEKTMTLLKKNKLDSLNILLSNYYKDSIKYNKLNLSKLHFIIGLDLERLDFEDKAFKYFKKCELNFTELKEDKLLSDVQYELFLLLKKRDREKSLFYLDKYYDFVKKSNNYNNIIKAYLGYGVLYFNSDEYRKAEKYYNKIIKLSKKTKDTIYLAKAYNNKAILISNYYGNQDSTRYYYQKALNLYNKTKRVNEEFAIRLNIGTSYKNEKKYKQAIKWFLEADNVKTKKYKKNYKRILYANLATSYKEIKNYKKAYYYFELYDVYKDSVNIEKQNVAIADLDKKYQTEKKEKENILLKNQKRTQNFYLIIILGTLFGIILFGILALNALRKKREIAEKNVALEHQKVVSLVKEQEIRSMDAMVEGQELERKRIAEDLHDNLGSTLATLKLHFDNYRENISTNNKKQLNLLNSTENILSDAYNKVRTMAHTNNSSEIDEHNLIDAVKKLVKKISLPGKTVFEFIEYGFDRPIKNSLELIIFRTIQELMANIVKHAKASKATIDLTLFEDSINIMVEDNGIGFKNKEFQKSGMGLGSIRERILKINGTFEIDSTIGMGSTILINIPLIKEI